MLFREGNEMVLVLLVFRLPVLMVICERKDLLHWEFRQVCLREGWGSETRGAVNVFGGGCFAGRGLLGPLNREMDLPPIDLPVRL